MPDVLMPVTVPTFVLYAVLSVFIIPTVFSVFSIPSVFATVVAFSASPADTIEDRAQDFATGFFNLIPDPDCILAADSPALDDQDRTVAELADQGGVNDLP